MKHDYRTRGFTLIEVLLVLALMGFFLATVLASVQTVRTKSRDSRRLHDMAQISRALEFYYDVNGRYPPRNYHYTTSSNWNTLTIDLAPYINPLPRDPLGNQSNYIYYYDADSGDNYQTYGLMMRLEHSSNYPKVNDGGWYNSSGSYYEVGKQPSYCRATWNLNWWGSSSFVCGTTQN
ncbi:MAG: type II secretion system protein [bacterium]|nr:type II secretion system protein [bacterium]